MYFKEKRLIAIVFTAAAIAGTCSAQTRRQPNAPPVTSPPAESRDRADRIASGTLINVRVNEDVNARAVDSRAYSGSIDQDVHSVRGALAIPKGSMVDLIVRQAVDRSLILDLDSVIVEGKRFAVDTDAERAQSSDNESPLVAAIIGSVSGGQAGGQYVRVRRGMVLTFRLEKPLDSPLFIETNRPDHIVRGTMVAVQLSEDVNASRLDNRVYSGSIQQDIRNTEGVVAVPRGSPVELIVRRASDRSLFLDLESIEVAGKRYAVSTDAQQVQSRTNESPLVGAIIGSVSGGQSSGRYVRMRRGMILTFRLQTQLEIDVPDNGANRSGSHYHDYYRPR